MRHGLNTLCPYRIYYLNEQPHNRLPLTTAINTGDIAIGASEALKLHLLKPIRLHRDVSFPGVRHLRINTVPFHYEGKSVFYLQKLEKTFPGVMEMTVEAPMLGGWDVAFPRMDSGPLAQQIEVLRFAGTFTPWRLVTPKPQERVKSLIPMLGRLAGDSLKTVVFDLYEDTTSLRSSAPIVSLVMRYRCQCIVHS